MVIDVPGTWAKIIIHDRDLLSLLHDLAVGTPAGEITTALSADAVRAVLTLMDWCGLLDRGDDPGWSTHDLMFHSRTRAGYARGYRSHLESRRHAVGRR